MPAVITQQQAKARGLAKFFPGTPCKRGHVAERYTNSRGCLACIGGRRERPSRQRAKAEPVAEMAAAGDERKQPTWRDPGTWVEPWRIDIFIERVFNNSSRVYMPTASEAA